MDEPTNVIPFPKQNPRYLKEPELVRERLFSMKIDTADELVDYIMPMLRSILSEAGIEVVNEDKMSVVERALESTIMEHYGYEDEFANFVSVFNSYKAHEEELIEVATQMLMGEEQMKA